MKQLDDMMHSFGGASFYEAWPGCGSLYPDSRSSYQLREVHGRTPTLDLNTTLIRFSKRHMSM